MNMNEEYRNNEAQGFYDIIYNKFEKINFFLDYYENKTDFHNVIFAFNNGAKKGKIFMPLAYDLYLKAISYNFEEELFEKILNKYYVNDINNELNITEINYYFENEFRSKNACVKNVYYDLLNQSIENKKNEKVYEEIIKGVECVDDILYNQSTINFTDYILLNNFNLTTSNKYKNILYLFDKYNVVFEEDNTLAQYFFTKLYMSNNIDINTIKKYINLNTANLDLFINVKLKINNADYNINNIFSYNRQTNNVEFITKLLSQAKFKDVNEKFNFILNFLDNETSLSAEYERLKNIMVSNGFLDEKEENIFDEKYLKYAISRNSYIKNLLPVVQKTYKKQKTHLFKLDGEYFYTLSVNSTKFFNSAFTKLKDDIKNELINSNIKGKNVFTQLLLLDHGLEKIDDKNKDYILKNFNTELLKNDDILINLLNLYKNDTLLNNNYGYYTMNSNKLKIYKTINSNMNNDFINTYIKNKNYLQLNEIKEDNKYNIYNFLLDLPYNKNNCLKYINSNELIPNALILFELISEKNNFSNDQDFNNQLINKYLKDRINSPSLNEDNTDFYFEISFALNIINNKNVILEENNLLYLEQLINNKKIQFKKHNDINIKNIPEFFEKIKFNYLLNKSTIKNSSKKINKI